MENFKKLVYEQKDITGVIELTLYNENGRLHLSSASGDRGGKELDKSLLRQVINNKESLLPSGGRQLGRTVFACR